MTIKRRDREQAELADAMRATMKAAKLTSEQLGEKLGYHAVVIRQWINASKPMSSRARRVVRTLLPDITA